MIEGEACRFSVILNAEILAIRGVMSARNRDVVASKVSIHAAFFEVRTFSHVKDVPVAADICCTVFTIKLADVGKRERRVSLVVDWFFSLRTDQSSGPHQNYNENKSNNIEHQVELIPVLLKVLLQ